MFYIYEDHPNPGGTFSRRLVAKANTPGEVTLEVIAHDPTLSYLADEKPTSVAEDNFEGVIDFAFDVTNTVQVRPGKRPIVISIVPLAEHEAIPESNKQHYMAVG